MITIIIAKKHQYKDTRIILKGAKKDKLLEPVTAIAK